MTIKKQWMTWMFAGALACSAACGDDEQPKDEQDASVDPVLPSDDAGDVEVEEDAEVEVDAGDVEVDAGDEVDAGEEADAGEEVDAGEQEPIEVAGRWFGGTEWDRSVAITSELFGTTTIVEYDNDANVFYTQNAADAQYNPGAFSRIVWSEPTDGTFYYCTIIFDGETLEDAKTREVELDTENPATAPCGIGTWTHLVPALELEGRWDERAYEIGHVIDSLEWTSTYPGPNGSEPSVSTSRVVEYDNEAKVLYTESVVGFLGFSRIVWRMNDDGSADYCTTVLPQASLEVAKSAEGAWVDFNDPEQGCNSVPPSHLTPAAAAQP